MTEHIDISVLSEELAALTDKIRESVVQVYAGDRGIGSGVVWSVAGQGADEGETTIITNAHVVQAARDTTVSVRAIGGTSNVTATVAAVDPSHDLAKLTVRGGAWKAAAIGDSTALRVGELVVAVGNPWGRVGAMTAGVVAARAPVDLQEEQEHADPIAPDEQPQNRRWGRMRRIETEVIQADIRLYPGNSGGPLTDAQGRVVGINAMVVGGLGFAIPSRAVEQFLAAAEHASKRMYLGVQVLTVPVSSALRERQGIPQATAALITAVEQGSPAETSGVLVGDILLAVNGRAIPDTDVLARLLGRQNLANAPAYTLQLLRGGAKIDLALTPELRDAA